MFVQFVLLLLLCKTFPNIVVETESLNPKANKLSTLHVDFNLNQCNCYEFSIITTHGVQHMVL